MQPKVVIGHGEIQHQATRTRRSRERGGSSDGGGLKKFSNKWKPDVPIKDQIKGQLGKLLKQFNVKGFDINKIIEMTPRQAEEFLKGKEGANKVFQQINKALQDGGHYY